MPGTVDQVRTVVPDECQVNRCRKEGCRLGLSGAPAPYVLMDMDQCPSLVGQNQSRCDYIFVGHSNVARVGHSNVARVVVMELKRGRPDASKIVPQLRAGARIADDVVPGDSPVSFIPIAVYGGGLHQGERNKFRKRNARVGFRGKLHAVKLVRCGTTLAAALGSGSV